MKNIKNYTLLITILIFNLVNAQNALTIFPNNIEQDQIENNNNSDDNKAVEKEDHPGGEGLLTPACDITSAGIIVSLCDDNGTVSDPSDDIFTFSVDPTGILLYPGNSYFITGNVSGSGNYGTPTVFNNGGAGYPAGTDLAINIYDVLNSGCNLLGATITAPGTCSPIQTCSNIALFTDSGGENGDYGVNELETYFICPDNPGSEIVEVSFTSFSTESCCDDLIIYDGSTTSNTIIGTFAGTNSPGTISSTDSTGCLTFVFDSDGSVVDSGWVANVTCLTIDSCTILNSNLSVSACNDNGTDGVAADDFYTFELNPTGFLLGSSYTITENVSGAIIGTANYGTPSTFGPILTSVPGLGITITDDSDSLCVFSDTIINPGSCSPFTPYFIGDCIDFDSGIPLNLIQSTSDDFDWSIGSSTPSAGTGPQNGDHTSGSGQFIYIETSSPVGVGEIIEISFSADLSASTNPNIQFYYDMFGNEIGTLNILVDDGSGNITTEFTISGNQGSGWTLASVDLTAFVNTSVVITFQAITNGSFEGDISIDDICLIDASICSILSAGLIVSPCDANGTTTNPNDDTFTFSVDPSGLLVPSGNSFTVSGDVTGSGTYGAPTVFDNGGAGYPTGTNLNIVITDDIDTTCSIAVTAISPASCSDAPGCGNIFVDSGGSAGVYGNNELSTVIICPENIGDTVQLAFTFVDIETTTSTGVAGGCWDFLTIYNGGSVGSPVLAQTLCGELDGDGGVPSDPNSLLQAGDIFQSTDASGCLTVVFDSDGSVTDEGWIADVNCLPGPNQCLPFLNVSGLIPSDVYEADDFLVSDGQINAGSGGAVSFYAGFNSGEYIELLIGFDCDGSQDFEAVNIDCDPTDNN